MLAAATEGLMEGETDVRLDLSRNWSREEVICDGPKQNSKIFWLHNPSK